jgi:hypothetical protein
MIRPTRRTCRIARAAATVRSLGFGLVALAEPTANERADEAR